MYIWYQSKTTLHSLAFDLKNQGLCSSLYKFEHFLLNAQRLQPSSVEYKSVHVCANYCTLIDQLIHYTYTSKHYLRVVLYIEIMQGLSL